MQSSEVVLALSITLLLTGLLLLAHRRGVAARRRAERARKAAEREDLGGNSYFMPLPPIEQAVELVANPVEMESLLAGEPATIAQIARRQLEETTDIGLIGGLRDLGFPSASVAPPPLPAMPAPAVESGTEPASVRRAAAPPADAARAAASGGGDEIGQIPVRELVLAWFEARGYRATPAPEAADGIELVLSHRKDTARNYAFVVERGVFTGERAAYLYEQARETGLQRLLIAAEQGSEMGLAQRLKQHGIRVYDESAIREQLGKVDIRIAAKIIAVARGRALAWRSAPTASAPRATAPTPH